METRQRDSKAGPQQAKAKTKAKYRGPEELERNKRKRRELYRTDPEFRGRVQESARKYYRKNNPRAATAIDDGTPAFEGTYREVVKADGSSEELHNICCYTLPEMARAMDKSLITIRSWIERGFVPKARYVDVRHSYNQYTAREVLGLAQALSEHFKEYVYLNANHRQTLQLISQKFEEAKDHDE